MRVRFDSFALLVSTAFFLISSNVYAEELWRHTFHHGRDPFTLPHTKVACVKWAKPWKGAKICVGHKLQCQHMISSVYLKVDGPKEKEARDNVKSCAQQAAAAGALTGIATAIATGGPGASEAAVATFTTSLTACVKDKFKGSINVKLDSDSHWGNYGGC